MSDGKRMPSGKFFFNALFGIIGSIPLKALYAVSDVLSFLMGRVVGYRRKVIRRNLRESFPEKTERELRSVERDFYGFLCDYFLETMRLGRMDRAEILKRMRFEGFDEVNSYLCKGQNVSLLLGHMGNWEWISSIPLHMPDGLRGGQIYHPLENRGADEAFLKIRGRFGAFSVKMKDTLPTIMKWRREGKPFMMGYIADQSPLFEATHFFTDFLNHDTPALTGHERISRMLHAAVFYCDVSRPKRGEYLCRFVKVAEDAASLPQFELTSIYYRMLEDSIRRNPSIWLWSHNRWKRTRGMFVERFGEEEAARRLQHL